MDSLSKTEQYSYDGPHGAYGGGGEGAKAMIVGLYSRAKKVFSGGQSGEPSGGDGMGGTTGERAARRANTRAHVYGRHN